MFHQANRGCVESLLDLNLLAFLFRTRTPSHGVCFDDVTFMSLRYIHFAAPALLRCSRLGSIEAPRFDISGVVGGFLGSCLITGKSGVIVRYDFGICR